MISLRGTWVYCTSTLVKSESEAYAVIAELHNLEFELRIDNQIHIAEMQINTHNFNEAKEIETLFYNRRRDLEDEIKYWKQRVESVRGANANLAKCGMEFRRLYGISSRIYALAQLKTEAEQSSDKQQIQEVTEALVSFNDSLNLVMSDR